MNFAPLSKSRFRIVGQIQNARLIDEYHNYIDSSIKTQQQWRILNAWSKPSRHNIAILDMNFYPSVAYNNRGNEFRITKPWQLLPLTTEIVVAETFNYVNVLLSFLLSYALRPN